MRFGIICVLYFGVYDINTFAIYVLLGNLILFFFECKDASCKKIKNMRVRFLPKGGAKTRRCAAVTSVRCRTYAPRRFVSSIENADPWNYRDRFHDTNNDGIITKSELRAWRWRSMMFLPQFAFKKALTGAYPADCFIIDFQDAVPLSMKATARSGLREAMCPNGLLGNTPVVVRINELGMRDQLDMDLDAILGANGDPPLNIVGVMPTMVECGEDLDHLADEFSHRERNAGLPEGFYKFAPLIETPAAVLNSLEIARAGGGRNVALALGHGDLFRITGGSAKASLSL